MASIALLSWTSADDRGGQPVTRGARGDASQPTGPALFQNYWLDDRGITHDEWEPNPKKKTVMWTGCGETAAQGVLSRFGHFAIEEAADQHTRPTNNWGGSLDNIRNYYRMRGLEARNYEGITWNEMKKAYDDGFAVITTMSVAGSDHTMAVVGMHTDPGGDHGKDNITWQDTNGEQRQYARPAFERAWKQVRLLGLPENGLITIPTGIHNHCTIVGKAGAHLPARNSTEDVWALIGTPAMRVLDAVDDIFVGGDYIKEGTVAGGIARSASGLVEAAAQLPSAIAEFVGTNLIHVGDAGIAFAAGNIAKADWFVKYFLLYPLLGLSYALKYATAYAIRLPAELVGGVIGVVTYYAMTKWLASYADWAHAPQDAINNLRQADKNGGDRQQRYWQQLCATPLVPGKTYLLEQLLRQRSETSRQMALKVFASVVDGDGHADAAAVDKLLRAIGKKRLDDFFAGSPAWRQAR